MSTVKPSQPIRMSAKGPAPTPAEETNQEQQEQASGDLGIQDLSQEQVTDETPAPTEAPTQAPVVETVVEAAPVDTADVVQHNVFKELSRSLNEFQEATSPAKPFTVGHHYVHEQNLARNLRFLLRSCPDELFDAFWKKVIELFHSPAYNALRPEYIHRDGPMWKEGEELAIFFTNVVALISVSTMGKVAAKKQINFERAFGGTEEVIRNKLIAFYA